MSGGIPYARFAGWVIRSEGKERDGQRANGFGYAFQRATGGGVGIKARITTRGLRGLCIRIPIWARARNWRSLGLDS